MASDFAEIGLGGCGVRVFGGIFQEGLEGAVDDEVGVAADGGGEVCVVGFCEAVVADGFGGVGGAFERFQEAEFDGVFFRGAFGGIEEFLDVGAVGEVAGVVAVLFGDEGVVGEARWIRIFMDAEDGGLGTFAEDFGDGLVGDEHAFLDELVGFRVDDLLGGAGASVFIEFDFDLGHFEVEGAVCEAVFTEEGRHFPSFGNGFDEAGLGVFGGWFSIEDFLCLFVGEFGAGVDDGIDEMSIQQVAVCGDFDDGAFGEAIDVGFEGADAVGEFDGEHGEDAVDEVGGVAAFDGFLVHGGAGFDVVGDIRDVDFEVPAAVV